MPQLFFKVDGDPVGKGRPRHRVIVPGPDENGNAREPYATVYTDADTRAYEQVVGIMARAAMSRARIREPFSGPLELTIAAYYKIPAGWPPWKRQAALDGVVRPTTKPDRDNIEKIIADGLNGIAWGDDSQVVDGRTVKLYAERARVEVFVDTMDECAPMQIGARRDLPAQPQQELFHEQQQSSSKEEAPGPASPAPAAEA